MENEREKKKNEERFRRERKRKSKKGLGAEGASNTGTYIFEMLDDIQVLLFSSS